MIGNCSAHGKKEILPPVSHVRLDVLLRNMTCKVQCQMQVILIGSSRSTNVVWCSVCSIILIWVER